MAFMPQRCTMLANYVCPKCIAEKEADGIYVPTQEVAPTYLQNERRKSAEMDGGDGTPSGVFLNNQKEGFLMVKSDGTGKKFKKAFKKFYVSIVRASLVIKKSAKDGKALDEINLENSLIAFQRDNKGVEYIRIANSEGVLELKPQTADSDEMNLWKKSLQGHQTSDPDAPRIFVDAAKIPQRGMMRGSMYAGPRSPASPSSDTRLTDPKIVKARGPDPVARSKNSPQKASKGVRKPDKRKFMEIMVPKTENQRLGMRICGGVGGDPNKPEIRVHSIQPGSVASGLNLEVGDIIVHINHRKLDDVTVQAATKILQKAEGLVAMGIARHNTVARRSSTESVELNSLPFAEDVESPKPPPPAEDEETFGFPQDGGAIAEEEEGEDTMGFPDLSTLSDPEPVAEPAAPPPPSEAEAAAAAASRAERMAKMKAARAKRRNSTEGELTTILAWIDALDENMWY